jgi:aldehyde dehydrogenase (NAD+)
MQEFNPSGPLLDNDEYSKIVSANHFGRLSKILADTKGEVVIGGNTSEDKQKIEVTIVKDVLPTDSLMAGEIFGPILPILTMDTKEEIVEFINANENPLALYSFTGDGEQSLSPSQCN